MKKIRYLPFGYTIRNGHTVVEQQEADIVRNIFKALHTFIEDARSNLIFFLAGDRTGMAADAFVDIDDDSES